MRHRLLLILTFLLVTLAACGTGGGTTTPEPLGEDADGVPLALLEGKTGSQEARAGTRCWDGMCVDMIGVIAPAEALHVAPGEELTLRLGAGEPSGVSLRVLGWQPSQFDGPDGATIIGFDAPLVASGNLDGGQTLQWNAPDDPGEYALSLFTGYSQGGDISYGFHIIVDEG